MIAPPARTYEFGEFRLDAGKRRLWRRDGLFEARPRRHAAEGEEQIPIGVVDIARRISILSKSFAFGDVFQFLRRRFLENIISDKSNLVTTAEELLPPWQPCRRSYT